MGVRLEELSLRYWKASLAWHNRGKWAEGWTQEGFIDECRLLCSANENVGRRADELLDNMIYGREEVPLHTPGEVVYLRNLPIKQDLYFGSSYEATQKKEA